MLVRCIDCLLDFKLPINRISDAVYAETEQERHEAEVNYASKQTNEWIKEYLAGVMSKRGFEAYQKLRNDLLKRRVK